MRANALSKLYKAEDIMMGSLVLLKRRCGTKKKYPAYYISESEKGKTLLTYIRRDEVGRVRRSLKQYKELKRWIRKICKINKEILILERRCR